MPLFDNARGFKPEGKVLKLWTLLPQVSTTIGDLEIPPLFGNLKNLSVYYIGVFLLVAMETYLIYYLQNEGVPVAVLIIFSLADFFIAFLPFFFELSSTQNTSLLNANIFIYKNKLRIKEKLPSGFNNYENFQADTLNKLQEIKKQNQIVLLKKAVVAFFIIGSGLYKFYIYWGIFGNDIFIEGLGRFIIISIFLGIVIHLLCTKTVIYHILFSLGLKKQLKAFESHGAHKITVYEKNKSFELNYLVPYKPVVAGNQRICQQVEKQPENGHSIELKIGNLEQPQIFSTDKINGNENVCLIHTGILLESEINNLFSQQADSNTKIAVASSCKEVQTYLI